MLWLHRAFLTLVDAGHCTEKIYIPMLEKKCQQEIKSRSEDDTEKLLRHLCPGTQLPAPLTRALSGVANYRTFLFLHSLHNQLTTA